MPRIHFRWENINADLREIIASVAGLPNDAPATFDAAFGKRPTATFIKTFWSVLLQYWLAHEPSDAHVIAEAMRASSLGNLQLTDDLAYIQSCVTADAFIAFILNAFIAKGQQSAESIPLPPRSFTSAPVFSHHISMARAKLDPLVMMHNFVAETLKRYCDPSTLAITSDGEFMIAAGSCTVHINVQPTPFVVRVHAAMLTNVTPSPALYESLNSINIQLPIGRVFFEQGTIYVESSLLDATLNEESLMSSVQNIAFIADFHDDRLQHAFGGKLMRDVPSEDQIDV